MAAIRFVDTTIRDGHLSLWASGMTTGMMLPVAETLDGAGFDAIEVLSDGQMGKAVRDLKDDPFERIRMVAERTPNTPLRLIAGRINTFEHEPPEAFALFLELAARNGIAEVRISDPWNEYAGWKRRVDAAHAAGLRVILNLVYSISPVHTDAYYAERCRQAASLGAWRLCFKDPGGLLTPERTRALVPVMLENAGPTPVEFHTHWRTCGANRLITGRFFSSNVATERTEAETVPSPAATATGRDRWPESPSPTPASGHSSPASPHTTSAIRNSRASASG